MTENIVKDQPGMGRLTHAPSDHPPVARAKVGVVLANLGTPDATDYWSMRRYLNEFLSDKRVVDYADWKWQPLLQLIILTKRPFSSGKAYRGIWNNDKNESPLLTTTRAQSEKMTARLKALYGDDVEVDFCMRYGNPSTESVLTRLKEKGCERIVFFPLYPQYGSPTTATANDQAFRTLMKMKWQPYIRTVPAYFDHPDYIQALANSVQEAYDGFSTRPTKLVASYHGVPERYLMEGDPYHCQCQKTTRLLREKLGFSKEVPAGDLLGRRGGRSASGVRRPDRPAVRTRVDARRFTARRLHDPAQADARRRRREPGRARRPVVDRELALQRHGRRRSRQCLCRQLRVRPRGSGTVRYGRPRTGARGRVGGAGGRRDAVPERLGDHPRRLDADRRAVVRRQLRGVLDRRRRHALRPSRVGSGRRHRPRRVRPRRGRWDLVQRCARLAGRPGRGGRHRHRPGRDTPTDLRLHARWR